MRKENVQDAVDAGADAVGFISGYESSPRNLNLTELRTLIRDVPPMVSTVVVTPASNDQIPSIERLEPNYFQLYADGDLRSKQGYKTKQNVVNTVRPYGTADSIIKKSVSLSKSSRAIFFDGSSTSRYSKNSSDAGKTLEETWKIAKIVRDRLYPFPLILGGGLTEENVVEAVSIVKPYGVDVSSGVEKSPGVKDRKKIERFIENARNAGTS